VRQGLELTTIVTSVPIELDPEASRFWRYDREQVVDLLRDLEFRSIVSRVPEGVVSEGRPSQGVLMEEEVVAAEQGEYTTVYDIDHLEAVISEMRAAGSFTFDVETTGKDPMASDLVGVSLSAASGKACYIPVGHQEGGQIPVEKALDLLKPLFEDPAIGKTAHNGNYDMTGLAKYGIQVNLEILEGIPFVEGERVIRDLAQTGEYEIIVGHSTFVDGVAANKADFPDTLFVYSGSGNDDHEGGDNAYWIDVFIHEPAYLAGIIAGMTTQTNRISGVAAFPFPNVNAPLNAFVDGARSVNPDIEVAGVTYIESWFDPATASSAAEVQIANGSDVIYAERFGPFAAAEDAGNVRAVGHFTDQLSLSPVVLTSAVAQWDSAFSDVLDAWYDYTVHGVPYNSPPQRIVYQSMVDNGSALGAIADNVPADVVAAVEAARAAILAGELVVPLKFDAFE